LILINETKRQELKFKQDIKKGDLSFPRPRTGAAGDERFILFTWPILPCENALSPLGHREAMGQAPDPDFIRQLRRQSLWLKDSWLWLFEKKVLAGRKGKARPKALDVGCGPGFVMDIMKPSLEVHGIDVDQDMVSMCKARGLDVVLGRAEELPFEDKEFDIVYCSFLLLLVKDPLKVVKEMRRVSKRWVLALAEPDYGAWIDFPEGLDGLRDILVEGLRATGSDPFMGRKLRSIFKEADLDAEIGTHPGVWNLTQLKEEYEDQRRFIRSLAKAGADEAGLDKIEKSWKEALDNGHLFHYNPIFFAIGPKHHAP
jgi:SAM-dependent methyltransferase